jgi:hypothetical protein
MAEPWPPGPDGLYLDGTVIPWERVRPADIRAAVPAYTRMARVDQHRVWAVLVRTWEAQRGHAYD